MCVYNIFHSVPPLFSWLAHTLCGRSWVGGDPQDVDPPRADLAVPKFGTGVTQVGWRWELGLAPCRAMLNSPATSKSDSWVVPASLGLVPPLLLSPSLASALLPLLFPPRVQSCGFLVLLFPPSLLRPLVPPLLRRRAILGRRLLSLAASLFLCPSPPGSYPPALAPGPAVECVFTIYSILSPLYSHGLLTLCVGGHGWGGTHKMLTRRGRTSRSQNLGPESLR